MAEKLPRTIVALGFVSLFMDLSSEMIHGLLPLFLTGTLGASALLVGLIEGAGEALAQMVKLVSGAWSDRIGRRKPLILLGYGLAAVTKPAFAMAGSAGVVLAARLADRLGKGIRGAPRDALVADIVAPERRGAAYGLRQSMDNLGAVIGPLVAMGLMILSGGNFRLVFALAIVPALVAVLVLFLFVAEPAQKAPRTAPPARTDLNSMRALGPAFWRVTALGGLIALARISEAFLILKISAAGLPDAFAPLALVALSLVYAATAWPVGKLSDRIGSRGLLALSLAVLAAAHLALALTITLPFALAAILLWGLHMGLSQGLLAALVAASAPAHLRATAFGVFNLTGGVVTLAANLLAGALWSGLGGGATFMAGAVFALAALVCLPVLLPRRPG